MLKFYVNPDTWNDNPNVCAFETEVLRDRFAPDFCREVAVIPKDFSHRKYDYDFAADAWFVKADWQSHRDREEAELHRTGQMRVAEGQSAHFDLMGEPEQASAWRSYYRELYTLDTNSDWPQVAQWPVAPTEKR